MWPKIFCSSFRFASPKHCQSDDAPVLVHVDLDSLQTIAKFFGIHLEDKTSLVYTVAVPRFLEFFKKHAVKATFFVVAKDLDNEANVAAIRQAVLMGHEIANHTMTHPFGMTALSKVEKEKEIVKAHSILRNKFGFEPVGFRAPGYDIDEEILNLLQDYGYRYDSSLFPSFLVPALKIYSAMLIRGKSGGHADKGYGKWIYGFGPIKPYHPDCRALQSRGQMSIWEIPVSVIPFLRIPLHSTAILATSVRLARFGNWLLARMGIPYTLVLHGVDMLDLKDDKVPQALSVCPGFSKSLADKLSLLNQLFMELVSIRRVIRTIDYVRNSK